MVCVINTLLKGKKKGVCGSLILQTIKAYACVYSPEFTECRKWWLWKVANASPSVTMTICDCPKSCSTKRGQGNISSLLFFSLPCPPLPFPPLPLGPSLLFPSILFPFLFFSFISFFFFDFLCMGTCFCKERGMLISVKVRGMFLLVLVAGGVSYAVYVRLVSWSTAYQGLP